MYKRLVEALRASGIPFAEHAWSRAPQSGSYGVIALDSQGAAVWADGRMQAQALQGTVDLYARNGGIEELIAIQTVLDAQEVSWRLNSIQFEAERQLVHVEWVFEIEVL